MSIDTRNAVRELIPLKRRFGMGRDDIEDYARVLCDDSRVWQQDVHRAVTRAMALPALVMPHELMGLIHQARRDRQDARTKGAIAVEEGGYVQDHDCHNCGGAIEYRAPYLWCPACNAVQQVGRDAEGKRRYVLGQMEKQGLAPGPDHEWPETPEEAKERVRELVRRLVVGMDLNAAIAGDDELITEIRSTTDRAEAA
jgi:hypothetical protein